MVDGRTDDDRRRLDWYTISSPWVKYADTQLICSSVDYEYIYDIYELSTLSGMAYLLLIEIILALHFSSA